MIFGVVFTATRLNLSRFDNELRFRGQAHSDLTAVLSDPKVKAGLRCGPLTGPEPQDRAGLALDRRAGRRARCSRASGWTGSSSRSATPTRASRRTASRSSTPIPTTSRVPGSRHEGGVAIVVTSRFAIFKHAWSDTSDDARIQLPPAGFERVKTTRFYAAYVRC